MSTKRELPLHKVGRLVYGVVLLLECTQTLSDEELQINAIL